MSGSFFALPMPQAAIGLDALPKMAASTEAPLGAFLGASFDQGFSQTGLGQVELQSRRVSARYADQAAGVAPLDETAWRASPDFREGLTFRPDTTPGMARVNAEVFDERHARERIIASREGIGNGVAGFVAGAVGSLPTPENFLPIAGPALWAARTQRYSQWLRTGAATVEAARAGGLGARVAAGAGLGALEGAVGSLAIMPLTIPSRGSFGDDVTFADAMLDVVFGGLAGGVIGGAAGTLPVRDQPRQHAPSAARPAPPAPPGASGGADIPPAQQDAALGALALAAEQQARGVPVDLALLPPEARAEIEALRAQARRHLATIGPGAAGPGAGKADQVAGRSIAGGGDAVPGGTGAATTSTGTTVPVAYQVVELRDLVASHGQDFTRTPGFPAELQPRDRGQREYQDQVAKIASELRPEEVAASPLASSGAPIVGPDGVVESGNGRVLGIGRAYAEGLPTAAAYKAFLARQGFDVADMEAPVLIRRRTGEMAPEARRRFTRDANSDQVAQRTTAETAAGDAERLSHATLALIRGPDLGSAGNAPFIRAFVESLPQNERTALSRDGVLTTEGLARINRAIAARAYGDGDLIALLAERTDSQVDGIGRALLDAAPAVARLRALIETGQVAPELDPSAAIAAAVRRIQDARQAKLPLADMLDHPDMLRGPPDPAERAWLDLLLRRPGSEDLGGIARPALAARVLDFAARAEEAPRGPDLLGNPAPGFPEVMRDTLRDAGLEPRPDLAQAQGGAAGIPAAEDPLPQEFFSTGADPDAPNLPEPHAPAGDSGAALAAREGFDMDPAAEIEARRLADAGALPEDLAQLLRDADDMAAKVEKAQEAWASAAACAIRG